MLQAAKHLANTGCVILMICANTMHMFADRIRAEVPIANSCTSSK